MALDQNTQQNVIIAAAILAGTNGTDSDVKRHTERIAGYLSDGSLPMGAFKQIEDRDANTSKVDGFPATVIGMDKELTSTRGVVLLRTKPSKYHPNGQEFARTERTDTESGRAQAQALQALVGHKVFITKGVEGTGGNNVRVVRSFEDKGIDPEFMAGVNNGIQTNALFIYDYDQPQNQGGMGPEMLAKMATRQTTLQPA